MRRSYVDEIVIALVGLLLWFHGSSGYAVAGEFDRRDDILLQMVTTENCVFCEKWKSEAKPKLEKLIRVVDERMPVPGEPIEVFPTFYVQVGEKWERFKGYKDWESHRDQVRKALQKLGVEPVVKTCRPRKPCQPMKPVFATPIRDALWFFFRPHGFVPVCPDCGRVH